MSKYLIVALAAVSVALAAATLYYRTQYLDTQRDLETLNTQVAQQNAEAAQKLAELTAQRDSIQAAINQAAAELEKTDAQAKAEIERLTADLRTRPVRVRVVSGASAGGKSCGGAEDTDPGPAATGTADSGAAYGLLPESNSRRLIDALKEVETLSAAYNSCRSILIHDETATFDK
jgi:cell division septum initiation protein DivIVA